MAQLSPDERRLAATGKLDQIKPPAASKPASAPTTAEATPATPAAAAPAPAAETQATETTPAPTEAQPAESTATEPNPGGEEDGGEQHKGKRFRFSSEQDQAIAALAKSKGVSLLEAAKLYEGVPAQASQSAPATPEAGNAAPEADPEVAAYDTRITEAQTEIERLTGERDAASEDMDTKKANSLSDQIAELRADLRLTKYEKQGLLANREEARKAARASTINESRDRAFVEYPIFAKADSIEREALDNYTTKAINNPARASEFTSPDWPERIAKEFAEKHGIKKGSGANLVTPSAPAAPARSITKPAPQQVAGASGSKLLTGADGNTTPSATRQLTPERVKELIRTNPEARREIMRQLHLNKK